MNRDRLVYGSTLGISKGADLQESTPTEVGLSFYVMRPVRLTQARIFKHHLANGTIPVTLWDTDGTVLATKTLTWAADDGGFRYVTFDTPVNLVPNHEYKLTYFAASGHFAGNLIAYFVQDTYEPPFLVKRFDDVARTGGGMYRFDGTHGAPDTYFGSNYWCDPVVEYEVDLPACGPGYLEQFTNYQPNHAFPMGVFFADPEWLVDYASIGINTLINGSIANPGFREAILASGMDVWASHDLEQYVVTDPPLADQVVGYFLSDEPDLAGTRVTPQGLRDRMAASRRVDSSRPMMLNFGFAVAIMQGYNFLLEGQTLASAIPEWMEDMMIADVISLDIYTLAPNTQQGQWGVWTYPVVDQRLRNFSDNTKAVFGYVESTGQQPGYPLPDDIRKATWAHLISGVQGIVYFDHRFEAFGVTQDFAAMLHHTPTRTMMQDLTALVQALAGPLKAPEAGLVTAVASSNTTAGPLGGVYGVPIHYTSRIHGTRSYIFAMGIRPGATTATFTVPDAAGKTITVRGEGRTKTVASDGTFTDTFAADYSIHLYEWTTLPIASTPDPTPPPSPPPAPVANEFGWTEPTWVRPSGAGYVRYEDLYTTGDTLQEVINKVTNHNVLTFPEGTFTFSDFSYGGTVGINVGPNCGGLMGSGRNTIFQMVPGSSTKASLVPAQSTGATNPLWMMRIRDNDGAHFRGFRFIGTDQGHLYNGLGIQYSADSISSHLYLQAASWGDEKSPPGETFSWGNNHADRCKLWDSEIDGRTPGGLLVGASPLGWNNSVDADVRRVYAHHSRAGMPTWWQTTNIYTEDLVHYYTGDGHGLNHENSEGHIMHVRPVLIVAGRYSERSLGTSSGLHVNMGNAATDMTDVTFVDPVYDDSFHQSGGMCIAQYAGWNIGGPNQVVTYPTVIHNGVTKTVYNGRTVANPGNFVKSDTFVYN
jgi:hypothetical protein